MRARLRVCVCVGYSKKVRYAGFTREFLKEMFLTKFIKCFFNAR